MNGDDRRFPSSRGIAVPQIFPIAAGRPRTLRAAVAPSATITWGFDHALEMLPPAATMIS